MTAAVETYADDEGWHNRLSGAPIALAHHDDEESAVETGEEIARQLRVGHRVLAGDD